MCLLTDTIRQIKAKANFISGLVRSREHAETICLYNAQEFENIQSNRRMFYLMDLFRWSAQWGAAVQFVNKIVALFGFVIPALIMCDKFFKNEIGLGVITQTGIAFRELLNAMTLISNSIVVISDIKASGFRVAETIRSMENIKKKKQIAYPMRLHTTKKYILTDAFKFLEFFF